VSPEHRAGGLHCQVGQPLRAQSRGCQPFEHCGAAVGNALQLVQMCATHTDCGCATQSRSDWQAVGWAHWPDGHPPVAVLPPPPGLVEPWAELVPP
jgi:hypothetical protein